MAFDPLQVEAIRRSKKSVSFFLTNFAKLKHPSAGILPFRPFSYQRRAIKAFRKNRFNIFRKCRQSGASKISGAFATWFAMFHSHKTILVVSRTNADAMEFLRNNVTFIYENLPPWMRQAWKPIKQNEHEIIFPNESKIKSLTSHPDVLRSNASSLNIIDEAAFIQGMDAMWAGGWSTLQHGGNVIVISTTNGSAGWYYNTMTAAEAGENEFNPITINWWDMDWAIEYQDPLSMEMRRIAPREGLRKCETTEEIEKYGPYWSPWLEEQYRALQDNGEAWKFQQEILASFVGSGNTVLSSSSISYVTSTVCDPEDLDGIKITGSQNYVHPISGESEQLSFDFPGETEGFWIWKRPVVGSVDKRDSNGNLIRRGTMAHTYVMGVDIATGKGKDYSAIEVFDIDTMEQVAEFMARCLPRDLMKYVDRIGRYYNNALTVVERNNGGDIVIDALRLDYMYPNLWREKVTSDRPRSNSNSGQSSMSVKPYGWNTTSASKSILNKYLIDFIRDREGDGYKIYSKRLLKQFQTYVRKRDRLGRDTSKTEAEEGSGNYDDLVMACAMALRAAPDSVGVDSNNLIPMTSDSLKNMKFDESKPISMSINDRNILMPSTIASDDPIEYTIQQYLDSFTVDLGAIPISNDRPLVADPKSYF